MRIADEVGVVVRNTEIVELLLPTGQPQRRDRHALPRVQDYNAITRFQLPRRRPTLAEDIERVLRPRTDGLTAHLQLINQSHPLKCLRDLLPHQRLARIMLIP